MYVVIDNKKKKMWKIKTDSYNEVLSFVRRNRLKCDEIYDGFSFKKTGAHKSYKGYTEYEVKGGENGLHETSKKGS